jgi:hypothetical protein
MIIKIKKRSSSMVIDYFLSDMVKDKKPDPVPVVVPHIHQPELTLLARSIKKGVGR